MIYKTLHRENEYHEFTKTGSELICSGRASSLRFTSVTHRVVNVESTGSLWLRQTEHTRGHLWHKYRYSVTVNKFVCTICQCFVFIFTTGWHHKELYQIKLLEQTMTNKSMLHLPCHANKARTFKTIQLNS
jgi:hypothetical protein